MSVTSQGATVGWGLQSGGLKEAAIATWYRHKGMAIGISPNVQKQIAPPEIGGNNNPTGGFVSGSHVEGRLSVIPRLEGDFGWLLLAATGNCLSAANGTTGYSNRFRQAPGLATFLPFMGFRRIIPARTANGFLGEIFTDCIVSSMALTFPQVGYMSAEFDIIGRFWQFDNAPALWTWSDITEDFDSVPMVMKGSGIRLPNLAILNGEPLPATNARITLNNNTTTVREERVLGSYHPEDYTPKQRSLQLEFTYKWRDSGLYRFLLNGGDPATLDFQPCIPNSDFELRVESACDIDEGVINHPWALQIDAPNVMWQASPLQLSGDDLLMLQITGTAMEAASGLAEDYFGITVENEVSAYTVPA